MTDIERKPDEPYLGYINLNKIMRPQKLFQRKDFMRKVLEVSYYNSDKREGVFLSFDKIVVTGTGRNSITWLHPQLECLLVNQKRRETTEKAKKTPSSAGGQKKQRNQHRKDLEATLFGEYQEVVELPLPPSARDCPQTKGRTAAVSSTVLQSQILSDWGKKQAQRSESGRAGGVLLPWQREKRVLVPS